VGRGGELACEWKGEEKWVLRAISTAELDIVRMRVISLGAKQSQQALRTTAIDYAYI
jgi:hypothetical protein